MHSENKKRVSDAMKKGDLQNALMLIRGAITNDTKDLGDLYLAGEISLDLSHYRESIDFITRLINISISENEYWYLDAAYISRAYAYYKIGEYNLFKKDLEKINENSGELFWLKNHPRLGKKILIAMASIIDDSLIL